MGKKTCMVMAAVAALFGGYATPSSTAPRMPVRGLSMDEDDPVMYIAHQGEEALAPSHSKAAYRLAVEHGLDYMKLDVRETKDGHVVLQHDATLKRTMGWDVPIRKLTLAEILEKGRCTPRGGYTNETITTLQEALEISKGMKKGVWIDFKDFCPPFAEKVFGLLDEAGYGADRVIVATFNKPALKWVQENRPAVRRVAHTFIKRLPAGGFKTNAGDPEKDRVYPTIDAVGDALERHAKELGLYGFNLPHVFSKGKLLYTTPPDLVKRLRKAGYWISIWFANDAATAEYYRKVGVDAFVTNCKAHTMPDVPPPATSVAETVYDVRAFGAAGDGRTKDTAAIQAALDACAKTGGRVVVPPGTYLTGSIFLGDNTELHLQEGATLLGSPDLADYNAPDAYPQNFCSPREGWSAKHLILALERRNVAITGRGVIDGNGRAFFETKPLRTGKICWRDGYCQVRGSRAAMGRPGQEIVFVECTGVAVRDVTFRDMSCWSCLFHGCEGVTVGGVTVRNNLRNMNTDGFDVDSCRNVSIGDCDITTGDDAIAIRGVPGRLKDPSKVCENIRVSNIVCRVSADGVRVGVGDGAIRNVHVSDVTIERAGRGLHVQCCYVKAKAGMESKGVDITDIAFERIKIRNAAEAILVGAGYPGSRAKLENIRFDRIDAEFFAPAIIAGNGTTRARNVSFTDCAFKVVRAPGAVPEDNESGVLACSPNGAFRLQQADGVSFRNCTLAWAEGVTPSLNRAFALHDAPPPSVDGRSSMADRPDFVARIAAVEDGICTVTNIMTVGTSGIVRVDFVLKAEPESDIRCRAELSPPSIWDGRFWGVGNSGLGGKIPKLARYTPMGTAVVTTDIGTRAVTRRHLDVDDWPLAVRRDYSWRSTHLMTVYGKRIVKAYYGRAPQRSYFNGGSCGGRQAFSEAIRFPEDYDGIVAHLPANNYVVNRFNAWLAWNSTHDAAGQLVFSDEEMRAFADAAVEWRAAKDPAPYAGRFLADGRIDVAELDGILALAAKKMPSLLKGDKPARLKALHSPLIVDGECVSLGFAPGTYLGQRMKRKVSAKTTCQTIRAFAKKDGPWYNANSADLSPFFARGGKLIVTTGWEDQTISPLPIVEHYERLCAHEGGLENAMRHCRLFCAPGAAHGGGKGRATQGELGGDFARQALIGWVERGIAPDRIVVNDRVRKETFPVATYPGLFVKGANGEWTRMELPRTKPRLADFIFDCDRTPAGL